jgi:hypothetical protein
MLSNHSGFDSSPVEIRTLGFAKSASFDNEAMGLEPVWVLVPATAP